MLLPRLSKPLIAAIWLVIFFVGFGLGVTGYRSARDQILDGLVDDARRCAVAFDPADVQRLTGTRADLMQPGYLAAKKKLVELRSVNPHVRAVFLLRFVPETGRISYLADSSPIGHAEEAQPGEEFPAASD